MKPFSPQLQWGGGRLKRLGLGVWWVLAWGSASSQVLYSHPDHLGSTLLQTDSQGSIAGVTVYAPFGEILF